MSFASTTSTCDVSLTNADKENKLYRYQGILGSCVGLGNIIGPFISAAFTEKATWRATFWFISPLAIAAGGIVLVVLPQKKPKDSFKSKLRKVDFIGSFFSTAGMILLLIPISGGGSYFDWRSVMVIVMIIFGALCMVAFVLVEWKVAQLPTMPRKCLWPMGSGPLARWTFFTPRINFLFCFFFPPKHMFLIGPWWDPRLMFFSHKTSSPVQEPRRLCDSGAEFPVRLRLLQHLILRPTRTAERPRTQSVGVCGRHCCHGRSSKLYVRRVGPVHITHGSVRGSALVRLWRLDRRCRTVLHVLSVTAHLGHGHSLVHRGHWGGELLPTK